MSQVEKGEALLRETGFSNYRIRHEEKTARLEVPLNEIKLLIQGNTLETLVAKLKDIGFERIVLDLEGFRSGNLNKDIRMDNPLRPRCRSVA